MDTRRLRYFVEIVEAGSITRAAARAGVAQPALSQQVAVLESEMGAKLLSRSAAGVQPTAAGRALYARAKALLRQIEQLETIVREHGGGGLGGKVSVCIPPTLVDVFTLPLIQVVQDEAPSVQLQVLERGSVDVAQLVRDGEVDLAIASRTPDPELDIEAELLFTEPFLLAVPEQLEIEEPLNLRRLADLPWLSSHQPYAARTMLDNAFEQAGLKRRVAAELASLSTMLRGVQRGLGVAVLPACLGSFARSMNGIKLFPLAETMMSRPVLLWMKRTPTPASVYVADLIRGFSAEHVRSCSTEANG